MIRRHPDDALLMALAAGAATAGPSLVVAAHVERCPRCASRLRDWDAVGGALLDALEPAALPSDAFARTLDRIDAPVGAIALPTVPPESRWEASLPPGTAWPRALRGRAIARWRRLGPHLRFSRVTLPHDPGANVYLLRAPAGKALPVHRHRGGEVTHVLLGAYDVEHDRFATGDFDQADERVHHRPVVTADGECICLIAVEGRVAFDGPIARVVGAVLRM